MEIVLLLLGCGLGAAVIWFYKKSETASLQTEQTQKENRLGEITMQLEQEKKEKNELQGNNKRMFVENEALKTETKILREKNTEQQRIISKFEAEAQMRQKELESFIQKLERAEKKLEEEQLRVRREDEARQTKLLEEKNRIWNDHENAVLARLREVCTKPEIAFRFYENNELPAEFDGTIKPDFLIEFLGQYLVFDAKKSKDMVNYISDQVKKTAVKYKGNEKLYPMIFFIVPQEEISTLKKTNFHEGEYTFHVISQDAIEPILANFKRISEYEKIQEFDPQDRESLINLIANYDRHISFQNAANILLAKESVNVMKTKESLPAEFLSAIENRKQSMRAIKLKDAEVKKLSQDLILQSREISKLTSPVAEIEATDIQSAQESLDL